MRIPDLEEPITLRAVFWEARRLYGTRMRRLRLERGLSAARLAKLAQVTSGFVTNAESLTSVRKRRTASVIEDHRARRVALALDDITLALIASQATRYKQLSGKGRVNRRSFVRRKRVYRPYSTTCKIDDEIGGRKCTPLAQERLFHNLTLSQVSGILGMNPLTISNWEHKPRGSVRERDLLCGFYGKDEEDLFPVSMFPTPIARASARVRQGRTSAVEEYTNRLWQEARRPVPPDELYDIADRNRLVQELVATLPRKHRHVIVRRFGLDNEQVETLKEIGERMGFTRECIRQIEAKALRMLRRTSRSSMVDIYWEHRGWRRSK